MPSLSMFSLLVCHVFVVWAKNHHQHDRDHIDYIEEDFSGQETGISSDIANPADSTHFPWTHAPVCTTMLRLQGSDPVDTGRDDVEYCLYTNASFQANRGISIFTTPKIASSLAKLPVFAGSVTQLSSPNLNAQVLLSSGPSQYTHSTSISATATSYTSAIPSKGLGLFTFHALKRGDVVLHHTSVLISHIPSFARTFSSERERLLRIGVEQLPSTTRDQFLSLATIYGDEDTLVQDILKANAYNIDVEIGEDGAGNVIKEQYPGIWPEAARANHACAPKWVPLSRT
jgi:hypothetical protein